MKHSNLYAVISILCATAASAVAYPISLAIEASNGMWTDFSETTFLPAGAFFQVWWSADASYFGDPSPPQSTLTGGFDAISGDYVIWSGNTPNEGVWGGVNDQSGILTDAAVGGNVISVGYVYAYVYDGPNPVAFTPYVRSPVYGPGTTGAWGDPSAPQPPPPDLIDVAPVFGADMGTFTLVSPEPATMALYGLGILVIATRRLAGKFRR